MCITSKSANLSKTKILSLRKDDGNVFLSYANTARNLSDGRNCMILPIPGKLKKEWFYNTKEYSGFLNYISSRTIVSESLHYGIHSRGMESMSKSLDFTKIGMYDIHFSNDMKDLIEVNEKLELNITVYLREFFNQHYNNFGFVCCIFDAKETMGSQPIAFEYTPLNKNVLFYPSMDAHDGFAPKKETVSIDHIIIAPMDNITVEFPKTYEPDLDIPEFLNNKSWGSYKLEGRSLNGDFYFDLTQNMKSPNLKREYETII